MSTQYAQKVIMEYFKTNQTVCESFFSKQEQIMSLVGADLPALERLHFVERLIEANGKVIADILSIQEAGLKQFIGTVGTVESREERGLRQVAAETQEVDLKPSTKEPFQSDGFEKWLRAELARVTGFPEEAITGSTRLEEDIGLDSITIIEIFSRMIQVFPEFESYWSNIRVARNFEELLHIFNNRQAKQPENNAFDSGITHWCDAAACLDQVPEYYRPLDGFILHIKEQLAKTLGIDEQHIADDDDFVEDININIFVFEQILNEALKQYPQFKLAGRELLHARNLQRIRELLERFGQSIQTTTPAMAILADNEAQDNVCDDQIKRFILEENVVLSSFDHVEFPQSILLVGEPGKVYEYFRQGICDNGIIVHNLHLVDNGWTLAASNQQISLENILELKKALDGLRNAKSELPPVIFLAVGVDNPMEKEDLPRWMEQLDHSATGLFALAKASGWVKEDSSYNGSGIIGLIGVSDQSPAWSAAHGVLRAMRHDCPGLNIRSVWLTGNPEKITVSGVLKALLAETAEQELLIEPQCIRCKQPKAEPISRANHSGIRIGKNSLLLLIGGGDGITAEVGCMLARQYKCRIAAIGRTPCAEEKPYSNIQDEDRLKRAIFEDLSRELSGQEQVSKELLDKRRKLIMRQRAIWNTRQRIEAAGGYFGYYSADVTQYAALSQVIDRIHKELGPVHGLIHGAGIIELLREKTMDSFRRVINTKAHSIYHLYHLLQQDPLEFVILLSSIAAYAGSPRVEDYCAANEVLNQVAHYWNGRVSYPVRSLLWTFWSETGLLKNAGGVMKHFNCQGLSNELGVELFHNELLYGEKANDWVLYTDQQMLDFLVKAKEM